MELFLNTSSPLTLIGLTVIVALIIFASRKIEKEPLLIIMMVAMVGLLIYHSIYLDSLGTIEETLINQAYRCLAADLVLLLVTFISFLWIDDIVAKKKKVKSYDNSLDWFWNKL